jgi:hypothetical protein
MVAERWLQPGKFTRYRSRLAVVCRMYLYAKPAGKSIKIRIRINNFKEK